MLLPRALVILLIASLWTAAAAVARKASRNGELRVLTTVGEVRALSREEAARGYPVRISGMITYHEPRWYLTYIQDHSGGVYISAFECKDLRAGDLVEIEGFTAAGRVTQFISDCVNAEPLGKMRYRIIGRADHPEPIAATDEHLRGHLYDGQWIEVKGRVLSVGLVDDRALLSIKTGNALIRAILPGYYHAEDLPTYLRGLSISARGVWFSHRRGKAEPFHRLCIPGIEHVSIEPSALEEVFRLPPENFSAIVEQHPRSGVTRQLVRGQVLASLPGRGFFLLVPEEGWKSSIWVKTTQSGNVRPGQWTKAVGWPELVDRRATLRDALFEAEDLIEPVSAAYLPETEISDPKHHGYLVQLEAQLLERRILPAEYEFLLQTAGGVVSARLPRMYATGGFPPWERGSRLRVTGVCLNAPSPVLGSAQSAAAAQVLLRGVDDAVLVARPSWWTLPRILWVSGAAAGGCLVALAWAAVLRQRVRAQTEIIRAQLERETLGEERARISREWHDTLEQHLAGISLQIEAAHSQLPYRPDEARRLLERACAMASHSREESRRAIWDLRAPALESGQLVPALQVMLREVAETTGIKARISCVDQPDELEPRMNHQLFRIAQEATTNVIKHANATRIEVSLSSGDSGLTLSVKDDGRGFTRETRKDCPRESFGIRGMRERADKIGAELEIRSEEGNGTEVRVTVPFLPFQQHRQS